MIITIDNVLPDDKGNEYKVVRSIKSGGFGQVFLCERIGDKKKFALKTMLNVFPTPEEYIAFQNELNLAKKINAENTITYEFMHDGKILKEYPPFIIMEFADQGSLNDLIKQKRMSNTFFTNDELYNMFLQLSLGMEHVNSILVHRDIKPDNILIKDNVLKITDFGLAKYSEATTRNVTFKGYGTAPYCAPEVWRNEKNTIAMDIYSMGIVFYELATLNYPYEIIAGNYEEAHLYTAVENPIRFNSSIAPNLVSVINRMLQKPKSKRFSNWQEIIDILNKGNKLGASDNKMLSLVQSAVEMQNATDNARQRKEAEEAKKRKEWWDHVKNIMFHFDNEILNPLREYTEIYNSQYASGQIVFNSANFDLAEEKNIITIKMPNFQTITITLSVLDPEAYKKTIGYTISYGIRTPTATRYSHPTCRGKKVLAWGKIEDNHSQGYNILLLDNKIDEYGDWFIMYNTNSGFNRDPRPEPFAFSEKELPKEINYIDATHIYISNIEKYNIDRFQELIALGQLRSM